MRTGKANINLNKYYYSGDSSNKSAIAERTFAKHLERVDNMKPSIVTQLEPLFMPRHGKDSLDPNTQKLANEIKARIDRENEILLGKLARIVRRKPEFGPPPTVAGPSKPTNWQDERRKRENIAVQRQNEKMLGRIKEMSQKSVYDRGKMAADYQQSAAYGRSLAHYRAPVDIKYPIRSAYSGMKMN